LDSAGRLTDSFADNRGVSAVRPGDFESAVSEIRERFGDRPMLLAGMIGSRNGWREAAYVPCPAGLDDLAKAILWVEPARTGIVPGLSQASLAGADVMRGEEVQVLGAVAAGAVPPGATVCHPGTHAKWMSLQGGRITAFRTKMTGELFSLVAKHSILAPLLQGEARLDAAFELGVDDALRGVDMLTGLFRIRARHLLGETIGEPASYASGLVIGCDVRAGLGEHREEPIALVGRPDLCALYAAALDRAGHRATQLDGAEAFLAGIRALTEIA
jgi:2-dehydro-3-deoxygalactonokinase